ncbi:hypothetical protein V6N13_009419 [Hibiscus sabdariffa]
MEFSSMLPCAGWSVCECSTHGAVRSANQKKVKTMETVDFYRDKAYWKERLIAERAEMVKLSKEYWESQIKHVIASSEFRPWRVV